MGLPIGGNQLVGHFQQFIQSGQTLEQLVGGIFAEQLVQIGFLPRGFRADDDGDDSGGGRRSRARELRGVGDAATTRDDDADADVALVKAVLCAGAYPNVMTAPPDLPVTGVRSGEEAPSGGKGGGKGGRPKTAGDVQLRSTQHGGVHLHPCCLIFRASSLDWRHLVYHELVRTRNVLSNLERDDPIRSRQREW